MTAPTPRSAEAVVRDLVAHVLGWSYYDPLSRRLRMDDAVALVVAALTAHATAAVAAERERCARVLCEHCRRGEPLVDGTYHERYSEPGDGRLIHWRAGCDARAIRRPEAPRHA